MAMTRIFPAGIITIALALGASASAGVGDPQVRTDDPWYPGELAISTFDRLFATQAEAFERVTGRMPTTDEDKALASWLWRNTHYAHGEEGAEDLWGQGFTKGKDLRSREYWNGLFTHGFGLCGTTHSQWAAELDALFGHGRGRGVGVRGHNAFEVFLTGGHYGAGRWVLLDHDLSTVIFGSKGERLLGIAEIQKDLKRLIDTGYRPERQHGWPVCGLHPDDGGAYADYSVAEYLPGYAGAPPMVNLRRGETLRRYLQPGLEDGKRFVFWGRNYQAGGIPGPERSRTWVNQPDAFFGTKSGSGHKPGQARFGNAVFTYKPTFANGDYRDAVIDEGPDHVTFGFQSPYLIAATPPNNASWGIYDPGGTNGLVLRGRADCDVSISTDHGGRWADRGAFSDGLDLTDHVKGHRQYWLKLHAGAAALAGSDLTITTVCQANPATMPRLKAGGSRVTFLASNRAVSSAGPAWELAKHHIVEGGFGTPRVTLEPASPRGEPITAIFAAAHVNSSNPPDPMVRYQIEYSLDRGKSWQPLVRDWSIPRMGDEPGEFWSQSLCWGGIELEKTNATSARVRFRNDGGKAYARAEAHVVYRTAKGDATRVTLAWNDADGEHNADHAFEASDRLEHWELKTGRNPITNWVEMRVEPRGSPR